MDMKDLQLRGLRRKLDGACRLYLPQDIRRAIGVSPGDIVEYFIVGNNEGIFIKLIREEDMDVCKEEKSN